MATEEEKSGDFYAVLGLKKECSEAELRNAYKKLAMKWHPDKCSASDNAKRMDEAKEKFQEIQKAYSVLSDSNKRFLYDFGIYDKDDDSDEKGMGDFIGAMAQMMSQTKPSSAHENFEELQRLFVEMFHDDLDAGFCGRQGTDGRDSSSSSASAGGHSGGGRNKRGNSAVDLSKEKMDELDPAAGEFCFGSNDAGQSSKGRGKRRNETKQKASSKHD